jgi:lysyl-tRNA synthetase class 2
VITVHDAVSKAVGIPISSMTPCTQLREICAAHMVRTPTQTTAGDLVVRLYEQLVEKRPTSRRSTPTSRWSPRRWRGAP